MVKKKSTRVQHKKARRARRRDETQRNRDVPVREPGGTPRPADRSVPAKAGADTSVRGSTHAVADRRRRRGLWKHSPAGRQSGAPQNEIASNRAAVAFERLQALAAIVRTLQDRIRDTASANRNDRRAAGAACRENLEGKP
jgi:hypothetical protein